MQVTGRSPLMAILGAIALVAIPAIASAHAFPESSDPAPGANLQTAPSQVTITFDDEIDPDGSSFKVTDSADAVVGTGESDLTVADRNVLRGDVTISEPGLYTVAWRALSIDGDETTGSFTFGFQATQAVPSDTPQEESPDTAMHPADTSPPYALAGVLLVVIAVLLLALMLWRRRAA